MSQSQLSAGPQSISLLHVKGGSGKTTTALAMGDVLAQAGYRVGFVDFDPQGTLSRALSQRTERSEYVQNLLSSSLAGFGNHGAAQTPGQIDAAVAASEAAEEDFLIFDTPGIASATLEAAVKVSSIAVTPLTPSIADIDPLGRVRGILDDVDQYRDGLGLAPLPWALLISRAKSSSKETTPVYDYLDRQDWFHSKVPATDSVSYRRGLAHGLTPITDITAPAAVRLNQVAYTYGLLNFLGEDLQQRLATLREALIESFPPAERSKYAPVAAQTPTPSRRVEVTANV